MGENHSTQSSAKTAGMLPYFPIAVFLANGRKAKAFVFKALDLMPFIHARANLIADVILSLSPQFRKLFGRLQFDTDYSCSL